LIISLSEPFIAGIVQEDILSNLSNSEDLLVIPRTSMLQTRETGKTLSHIAIELEVRYLVEGSVRKSEFQVLVTVQLFKARTGRQYWSGYF
jgi:adenylate cyclase